MPPHMPGSSWRRTALALAFSGTIGCGLFSFPPPELFPEESDVVDGDVSIVSVDFQVDDEARFYTSIAHMLGRDLGGVKLNFADAIELKNTSDTPQTVTVQAGLQGFSLISKRRVELAANETKKIDPLNLTYDFESLYSVTKALDAKVHLAVYQGEDLVALKMHDVTIEPVNRFRWAIEGDDEDDEALDIRGLSAVLVTPADRSNEVQKLMVQAAQYTAWGTMHGYQGGTRESALDQVKAVYSALKARNTAYARVADTFFDAPQFLKLPAQSLMTAGGTSFDGSLVMASAFEAMGMQPLIVFMKGHALVGVRLEPNNNASTVFIETTMIAKSTFEQAVNAANTTVQQRIDAKDPELATADVAALRRNGIASVNL